MRLRSWLASWIAACVLTAGCGVPARNASSRAGGDGQAVNRRENVEATVVSIIASLNKLRPEKIQRSSRFVKDLGLDSLDIVELVMETEEKFDITIADADAEKLQTVGELVDYIKRRSSKVN
jgi:acyl carrier protein